MRVREPYTTSRLQRLGLTVSNYSFQTRWEKDVQISLDGKIAVYLELCALEGTDDLELPTALNLVPGRRSCQHGDIDNEMKGCKTYCTTR